MSLRVLHRVARPVAAAVPPFEDTVEIDGQSNKFSEEGDWPFMETPLLAQRSIGGDVAGTLVERLIGESFGYGYQPPAPGTYTVRVTVEWVHNSSPQPTDVVYLYADIGSGTYSAAPRMDETTPGILVATIPASASVFSVDVTFPAAFGGGDILLLWQRGEGPWINFSHYAYPLASVGITITNP